jgi:hypothetical protein
LRFPESGRAAAFLALAALALFASSGDAQRYVPTADPAHPRVKYADSTVSINDRCIVRKVKLGNHVRPVYVNQEPVGFC